MSWFTRFIALLVLGGVFLLASFMGGMIHSIVAELTRGTHRAWWAAALLLIGVTAGLAWRYFTRTPTRPSVDAREKSPPQT
jgi:membrane protein implicated in regulation of membrane protease activity